MIDEGRGWRALPPPLLLGLGLTVLEIVVMTSYDLVVRHGAPPWLPLAELGGSAVTSTLCAFGVVELADLHVPRTVGRAGLWLAAFGWIATLVLAFLWFASVRNLAAWTNGDRWAAAQQHAWYAVTWLPIVGLALAAWMCGRRALALVGLGVALVGHPPPFALHGIKLGYQSAVVLDAGFALVRVAVIAVLARALAAGPATPDPARVIRGLGRAAAALWLRVLAVAVSTGVALLAATRAARGGGFAMPNVALVAGAAINAVALCWFAISVLGAARGTTAARYRLVIAGALSMWCASATFAQFLCLYAWRHGGVGRTTEELAVQLPLAIPVVAVVGLALVASEIVAVAQRCGARKLYDEAFSRQVGIVVAMLAGAAIQGWIIPTTEALGIAAMLSVLAVGCTLIGLFMAARLCGSAAAVLAAEPALPSARVVESA
jgi:hypothetical protein